MRQRGPEPECVSITMQTSAALTFHQGPAPWTPVAVRGHVTDSSQWRAWDVCPGDQRCFRGGLSPGVGVGHSLGDVVGGGFTEELTLLF